MFPPYTPMSLGAVIGTIQRHFINTITMTDLKPFTIHTDRCIVCQEEGKKIVAEGNGFHHS
jgi:hypothetical protein